MTGVIDSYALSPVQAGMLFHSLSGEDPGAYVEQVVATLGEALDEDLFLRAWQRVAERHAALRSCFRWEGLAEPVQEVLGRAEIPAERLDWRSLGEAEREQRFETLAARERIRGFDLRRAPVMRLVLVRAGEREHRVLWTTHHGFLDGRSRYLLWREIFTLYEAWLRGENAELPPARPYREHIDWLGRLDEGAAKAYWQGLLAGFRSPTPLIAGHGGGQQAWGTHEAQLPAAAAAALRRRAREASVTLNLLLQAAWAVLLHRYGGESDVVFGLTRGGRGAFAGSNDVVGIFINTVPVRARIDPDGSLSSLLEALRAQHVALRDYEHTALVKIKSWSELPRGVPLFESILVFDSHTLDAQLRALGGPWRARRFRTLGHTNYPLAVAAYGDRELLLQIQYSRKRFDDALASRMLGHLQSLLEGMAALPDPRLKELALLTDAERDQVVGRWNRTALAYPAARCMHELFAEQARARPQALALSDGAGQMSYGELDQRAEALALRLRSHGVQPGSLVAIYLERSMEMVLAILGVWKAGCAYVPIDPDDPAERVRFMLQDAQAAVTLTRERLAAGLPGCTLPLCVDAPPASMQAKSVMRRASSAHELAYVIYTSGSSGRPKGVPITHASLFNLVSWHREAYGVKPSDRATQIAGPAFDGAVWELWPYLTAGASVHIPDEATRLDAASLVQWLAQRRITLSFLPTPLAEAALRQKWPATTALRALLTGGDRLTQRPAPALPFRVFNHYGPTENTVVSTCAQVEPAVSPAQGSAPPPIGRPLPNTQAYIVDAQLQPVPIGVPGELVLGGVQLSAGYWNRAQLSAEKFIADPFGRDPAARLYRTGDRARFLPDGNIEFLGRIDQQVKLRGLRIEPGEIEAALKACPGVRDCVVIAREDSPGNKRLVAYLESEPRSAELAPALRAALKRQLPHYMLPAAFVCLERLPLTRNGKLDRNALPAPQAEPVSETSPVVPRTEWELKLARIWEDVVGAENVGLEDNFFDLGGHSLMMVRLISEINRTHQVSLGVADLFANPTIAQLAALVERRPKGRRQPGVVPLQKGRAELPVYFMYAGPDEFRLARLTGGRHPLFGIDVPWPLAWRRAVGANRRRAFPTLEQLVQRYAAILRAHLGGAPCVLAGHSFGGVIAFETAHELQKRGGRVELVLLFDTWASLPNPYRIAWAQWRRQDLPGRTPRVLRWLLRHEKHRLWSLLNRLTARSSELTTVLDEQGMPLPWLLLERLYQHIGASYRPRPLDSRGILFRTYSRDGEKTVHAFDESLGWGDLFDRGLELIPMPGNHLSMLREHRHVLARKIDEVLKRHWSGPPYAHDALATLDAAYG